MTWRPVRGPSSRRRLPRFSAEAAWTTISGSLPPGAPADGYRTLAVGGPCAADTIEQRPAACAVVKLNAAEASQLTGIDTSTEDGALAAAEALRAADGAGAVTRGADGAVLVAGDGSALAGRLDAPGRYPVGSGDSFLAGLVTARAAGAGWADALALALGAGAANAAVPGAARFQRADAERLAGAGQRRLIARPVARSNTWAASGVEGEPQPLAGDRTGAGGQAGGDHALALGRHRGRMRAGQRPVHHHLAAQRLDQPDLDLDRRPAVFGCGRRQRLGADAQHSGAVRGARPRDLDPRRHHPAGRRRRSGSSAGCR